MSGHQFMIERDRHSRCHGYFRISHRFLYKFISKSLNHDISNEKLGASLQEVFYCLQEVTVMMKLMRGSRVSALRRRSAQVSRSSSAPRRPLCNSRAPLWTTSTRWRATAMVAMVAVAMAAAVIEVEEKTGETMSTAPEVPPTQPG